MMMLLIGEKPALLQADKRKDDEEGLSFAGNVLGNELYSLKSVA